MLRSNSWRATAMTDNPVSAIPRTTPLPEAAIVRNVVSSVKAQLDSWSDAYDSLIRQTGQIAILGGDQKTTKFINSLRNAMKAQETKNEDTANSVRDFLVNELQAKVEDDLRQQIEKAVEAQLNDIVQKQVAASLATHIPQDLQDNLARDKKELDELQRKLHNSESRRRNGLLKVADQRSPLHTIYKPDGDISPRFPKTLIAMSELDAETAKALMLEYQIADVSVSRQGNINRFMQFCGVAYQVVSALSADFDIID